MEEQATLLLPDGDTVDMNALFSPGNQVGSGNSYQASGVVPDGQLGLFLEAMGKSPTENPFRLVTQRGTFLVTFKRVAPPMFTVLSAGPPIED